jgi:hypothetical protein
MVEIYLMPSFRIHRLRDHLRQQFRFAPHMSGTATLKAKDYAPGDTVEAPSPYAAFFQMKDAGTPLEVGDLLESEGGGLRIFKYVGFEEAQWLAVEDKREAGADVAQVALH